MLISVLGSIVMILFSVSMRDGSGKSVGLLRWMSVWLNMWKGSFLISLVLNR